VIRDLDSQEQALRSGRRPEAGAGWGSEPRSNWGRLVAGEEVETVQSEPGDWPAFYRSVARALRDGGRAPVDPWDAVETLRILDLARQSAERRSVVALEP
jgi:predicted dehydrogenase